MMLSQRFLVTSKADQLEAVTMTYNKGLPGRAVGLKEYNKYATLGCLDGAL